MNNCKMNCFFPSIIDQFTGERPLPFGSNSELP